MFNMEIPCRMGDEVWCIRRYNGGGRVPMLGKVSQMYFTDDMQLAIVVKYIGRGMWGKQVFPTEKAAWEAIRR